jgi:multiple antibiotic resistance protein
MQANPLRSNTFHLALASEKSNNMLNPSLVANQPMHQGISSMDIQILITAIVSFFVIIDPVGTGLIFHALTHDKDKQERRRLAIRTVLISLGVVLCFGFLGKIVLTRLGISMEAFRIAGGLLLLYSAFQMVTQANAFDRKMTEGDATDLSVFPLSFPLIAGPGCLTLTILLFDGTMNHPANLILLVFAVTFVLALTLACLLIAPTLARVVGKTANDIFNRLLGVVLASLAIQFIGTGIKAMLS